MLLALLIAAATAAQAQGPSFGGGNGTTSSPYIISTTDHMLELAASVNSGNDHSYDEFVLLNDLDFDGIDFTPIGGEWLNDGYTHFSGTFDGLGHKILNLRVGCNYFAGIFGYLHGTVRRLTLGGDSRIEGGYCVGGIVGSAAVCDIIDCHVEKTVTIAANKDGSTNIGGIVGISSNGISLNGKEIEGCTSAATVTHNGYSNVQYVGGIAGRIIRGDGQYVRNCTNYGAVSGSSYVGGVVGEFDLNNPKNKLENCYTGGYCTLYGVGQPGSSQGINIEGKAVSMHTITFGDNVQGNVTTSPTKTFEGNAFYAAGMPVSLNIIPDTSTPEGYLPTFYLNAEPKRIGYEIETVMPAENVTVTVDATDLLRDIGYSPWVSLTLNQESFDYDGSQQVPEVTVTDIKDGTPVTLVEGTDYEVLPPTNPTNPGNYTLTINGIGQFGGKANALYVITTPDRWPGMGTADKPYLILTTDHLRALADSVNSGKSCQGQHFSLQNDLDFSGKDYVPIGEVGRSFKGTFNGNGHSINHVVINDEYNEYQGLFGYIGTGGSVSGLTLGEGSSIVGNDIIGGIAAVCEGTISDCSTAEGVFVGANNSAGGIACIVDRGGRIADCQNRANVSGSYLCGGIVCQVWRSEVSGCINYGNVVATTWIAGGIAGTAESLDNISSNITECVNEGTVSASQRNGGIVGWLTESNIANCLNLGAVEGGTNQVGGIAGFVYGNNNIRNNCYAGACTVGGIGGTDRDGAQRGYNVSSEKGIKVELYYMTNKAGLDYNGKIYAGHNQTIYISISPPEGYTPINSSKKYTAYTANTATEADLTTFLAMWMLTMPADDVIVTGSLALQLLDDDRQNQPDNATRISNCDDSTDCVMLSDRRLYDDGRWNTLCLPFNVDSFEGSWSREGNPLGGAIVKELASSSYNASTQTLTLNFASVSAIEAGKPYIVRWTGGGSFGYFGSAIFDGVTISKNGVSAAETDCVDFIGNYSPVTLAAQDRTVLFMGGDSKLYYPSDDVTVNAFRGYFQLKNGLTAGDLPTNEAKTIVLNFGDETTGIDASLNSNGEMTNAHYYSIDGRKLNGEPTQKGVYFYRGKKVVK